MKYSRKGGKLSPTHPNVNSEVSQVPPGDIPAPILDEFLPEFVTPITVILKEAVRTHEWQSTWKKEYHIPIKKVPVPKSEDDMRGIGLTNWVSKQLERLLLSWIWP